MSVAGISSSSFANQSIVNGQNQQQPIQNQFQWLAQEFKAGNSSTEQTGAIPPNPTAVGTVATPGSSTIDGASSGGSSNLSASWAHGHWHHHHVHANSDADSDSETANSPSLGQLGQPVQGTSSSSAQQAYGSVQQDLNQIALNSDLITAQSAALQASSLSLTA